MEEIIKPENDTYKHSLQVQIRFSDFDALNHVNNSVHAQYYDLGRINYFETVMGGELDWAKVCVVIVNTENNFFVPIVQNDKVFVETKVVRFGNKSMMTHQRLIDDKGVVKGTCKTILAGYDSDTHASAPISDKFKRAFLEYEK